MKTLLAAATFPIALLFGAASANTQEVTDMTTGTVSAADINAVAPALETYREQTIDNGLWARPQLSPRDRSIVTLAVMVARNQQTGLAGEVERALDNGVTPAEISELITHLAFYSGWANAMTAVGVTKDVFVGRNIGAEQLPAAAPDLLPLDQQAENARAASVQASAGPVSQGLVDLTGEVLFGNLWLRPGLTPRDRSLVTVSALMASGYVGQIPFLLNRAMDNGLTREQAGEVIAHVAFYAGWPASFSTVPIARDVFDGRQSN